MLRLALIFLLSLVFLTGASGIDAKTAYECCVSNASNSSTCVGKDNAVQITCIADDFKPAQFFNNPSSVINLLLSNLLLIAGIGLFVLVVIAGFQMIQSAGSSDAHAMEKWRNMLMYGVIGFVVILFAGAIIMIVERFTGVNILDPEAVLKGQP